VHTKSENSEFRVGLLTLFNLVLMNVTKKYWSKLAHKRSGVCVCVLIVAVNLFLL